MSTFKNMLVEIVFSDDVCPHNVLPVLQPEPGPVPAGQPHQVTPGQQLHHQPGSLQGELLLGRQHLGWGVLVDVLLLGAEWTTLIGPDPQRYCALIG